MNFLCFINGEIRLFDTQKKSYSAIEYDFEEVLSKTKKLLKAETTKIRPNFNRVWELLAVNFKDCDGYNNHYNKKDSINKESFETKFTKEISSFLDEKFPRKFGSNEEREKKEKWREQNAAFISPNTLRRQRKRLLEVKNGKKLY